MNCLLPKPPELNSSLRSHSEPLHRCLTDHSRLQSRRDGCFHPLLVLATVRPRRGKPQQHPHTNLGVLGLAFTPARPPQSGFHHVPPGQGSLSPRDKQRRSVSSFLLATKRTNANRPWQNTPSSSLALTMRVRRHSTSRSSRSSSRTTPSLSSRPFLPSGRMYPPSRFPTCT